MRVLRLPTPGAGVIQDSGGVFGEVLAGTLLSGALRDGRSSDAGARVIVWSGSMGDGGGDGDAPDPRNWGAAGWWALESACRAWAGAHTNGETRPRVCVRPHARHVVSDVPSCIKWLSVAPGWMGAGDGAEGGGGAEVLLDPVSMMTAEMVRRGVAEDFFVRVLESASAGPLTGGAGGVAGVVVANVRVVERADASEGGAASGEVVLCPLHRGEIEPRRLVRMVRELLPAGVPVVMLGEEFDEQMGVLRSV